jgi:two-component system response regulator HydG
MTRHDADPTTILRAPPAVQPVMSRSCAIHVTAGPDAGSVLTIEDLSTRRVLLGQSVVCDLRLSDRSVSRRHAALEGGEDGVRLIDLESSNGTWVNGVRVKDAYVSGRATVNLGSSTLRIEIDDAAHVIPASQDMRFHRVMGASPEMRRLYPVFARVAASDVPVLIEGETGTGKEVLAESLHEASPRREQPFIVFDCTTVSPALVEAELFGYERGAFTGAETSRRGLFEEAHTGTLFIDEIGDLDIALQSKLLRALERSEVRRIGSNRYTRVDVRIVAATRRDLDREVQARRFRDDLFYRLAVARVELPPLRRRQGDISLLARCFWVTMGGDEARLPPDVLQRFEEYDWPGNIRELSNAVARHLALGDDAPPEPLAEATRFATREDFLDRFVHAGTPLTRARQEMMQEFDRRYVKKMLELHGGSVARAAAACGIGRRYFQMIKARS